MWDGWFMVKRSIFRCRELSSIFGVVKRVWIIRFYFVSFILFFYLSYLFYLFFFSLWLNTLLEIVVLYGILIELSICKRRIKNRHFDKIHFGIFEVRDVAKYAGIIRFYLSVCSFFITVMQDFNDVLNEY